MAYQEQLADRLRIALDPALPLEERRMFGGLVFLFAGRMLCGTSGEDFMFRVGADKMPEAPSQPGARPIRLGDRAPMSGFVWVQAWNVAGESIDCWLHWCLENQQTLDPAQKRAP